MRFYANVPLVAGYVLMAIPACLGMLQIAAARGGYVGLSLFTEDRRSGLRVGAGLILGPVALYAAIAPEIHTPGPAGTEITEMFLACALLATVVTLIGAHWRLRRRRGFKIQGEPVDLGGARVVRLPAVTPDDARMTSGRWHSPTVVIYCDPTDYVALPQALLDELRAAGITVLLLDTRAAEGVDAPLSRSALLGTLSLALTHLQDRQHLGLLGLGLGGDTVLVATMSSSQVAAAMAVSPTLIAPTSGGDTGPGLGWLEELSLPQSWRWRRRWPTYQQSIADLYDTVPAHSSPSKHVAILCTAEPVLTIRRFRDLECISVAAERHFTLLEEPISRRQVIQWFQENLG